MTIPLPIVSGRRGRGLSTPTARREVEVAVYPGMLDNEAADLMQGMNKRGSALQGTGWIELWEKGICKGFQR